MQNNNRRGFIGKLLALAAAPVIPVIPAIAAPMRVQMPMDTTNYNQLYSVPQVDKQHAKSLNNSRYGKHGDVVVGRGYTTCIYMIDEAPFIRTI